MSQFIDDYFNAYFEWNPSAATSVGLHEYDEKIEDYSAAAIAKRIEKLQRLQRQRAGRPERLTNPSTLKSLMARSGRNCWIWKHSKHGGTIQ